MDTRQHISDGKTSTVIYSDCGAYRYFLSRQWDIDGSVVNFIMLNPSVADEFSNDPTIERCERRAAMWGYGGFAITNIFAWRDTDPHAMRKAEHPVGPENNKLLLYRANACDCVVAAWGVHGAHRNQGPEAAAMLQKAGVTLHHLGLTKDGHPRHPLYVSYATELAVWHPS